MMTTKLTKADIAVLRLIILAQSASDAGKGYENIYGPGVGKDQSAVRKGYSLKLTYILRAIRQLRTGKPSRYINYWVDPDTLITYFDIRIEDGNGIGHRFQISFHTPEHVPGYEKLVQYSGKGRVTRWNKLVGGSREAAEALAWVIREMRPYLKGGM